MSYAYPMFKSGEGNVVGVDGALASEKFFVATDFVTQPPEDILQNRITTDPWGRTGVPKGSIHPNPNYKGAVVTEYVVTQIFTPQSYEVTVFYTTDPEFGAFGGWEFSWEFQARQTKLKYSYDDPPKQIGHPYMRVAAANEARTHYGTNPETGDDINFVIVPGAIRSDPFDVLDADVLMRFDKVLERFSFSKIRSLKGLFGRTNSEKWNGFAIHSLLFVDANGNESWEPDRITGRMKVRFPTRVVIAHSDTPVTPGTLVTTHREQGSEHDIEIRDATTNEVVKGSFAIVREIDFDDIFRTLEEKKPVDPANIRIGDVPP